MNPGRQVIALSGMILFGSSALPGGEALAFGQQWRPMGGLAAAPARSYPRVANIPTFRPPVVAARSYELSSRQRARFADTRGARPEYAAAEHAVPSMPQPYGYPAPYYPPVRPSLPVWAQPFGEMAQAWQQVPLFARQFAWRPAEQPWIAAAPSPQQPRDGVQMAPRMTGFRPTGPAYAATYGSWRPSAPAASSPRGRYASQATVYTAARQPALAAQASTGWRSVDPGLASTYRAAAPERGYWRPDTAAAGDVWQVRSAFRPAAYGRGSRVDERTASRSDGGIGFTRDKLPGWVTTYQDADDSGACTWCGGS